MSEVQMEHLSERSARRIRVTGARANRVASAQPAGRARGERAPRWIGLMLAVVVSLLLWGFLLVGAAQLIGRLSQSGSA